MPARGKARISIERAYDTPAGTEGCRVLIDRIWPRGVSKDALRLDDWCKELAPSSALRKWFGHDPAKWDEFRQRYFRELEERTEAVDAILARCRAGPVTLVFGAKDAAHSNAAALKEFLERRVGARPAS